MRAQEVNRDQADPVLVLCWCVSSPTVWPPSCFLTLSAPEYHQLHSFARSVCLFTSSTPVGLGACRMMFVSEHSSVWGTLQLAHQTPKHTERLVLFFATPRESPVFAHTWSKGGGRVQMSWREPWKGESRQPTVAKAVQGNVNGSAYFHATVPRMLGWMSRGFSYVQFYFRLGTCPWFLSGLAYTFHIGLLNVCGTEEHLYVCVFVTASILCEGSMNNTFASIFTLP